MRSAILLACGAFVATGVVAQVPQLPPGAQPGAQQPRDMTPALPVPQAPFGFEIPPVIDRPLGVDEGARVFVNRFVIRSILDDPSASQLSAGNREDLERLLGVAAEAIEQARFTRQRLDEVGDDGFTDAERSRLIEFMQRVTRSLETDVDVDAYRQMVEEIRLSRLDRSQGMTIGQIVETANLVTQVFRDAGYFLARAVVPAQDVMDGVVTLQVLEGRLGRTYAENNEMYSDEALTWPFENLEGGFIHIQDMERALLLLADFPGVQAFGTFRPGEEVGTADLVVSVQDEQRWSLQSRVDNYGTQFTGEIRTSTTFVANNVVGMGDQTTVNLMQTFSPKNTLLGSIGFSAPIFNPATRLGFEVSRNSFDISTPQFQGIDFGGLSEAATLSLERNFRRSRQFNLFGRFDVSRKTGETEQGGAVFNRDELAVLGLQVRLDRVLVEANALESAFLRVDRGISGVMGVPTNEEALNPLPGAPRFSRLGATPSFLKSSFGYSRLTAISPTNTLLIRVAGQHTNDRLVSLEQFSIGGPSQLRAAATSQFLTDRGAFASVEWIIRAPGFSDREVGTTGRTWGDILSVSLFGDHVRGWNVDPIGTERPSYKLSGYGLSMGVIIPGSWNFKVQHARLAGGARPGTGANDPNRIEDGFQTWLEVNVSFR